MQVRAYPLSVKPRAGSTPSQVRTGDKGALSTNQRTDAGARVDVGGPGEAVAVLLTEIGQLVGGAAAFEDLEVVG